MTVEPVFDIFLEELRMKDIVIGTNGGTVTEVGTTGLAKGGPFTVSGVVDVPIASTAEAEAGLADDKAMTPKKVKEAIAVLGGSGTVTSVEGAGLITGDTITEAGTLTVTESSKIQAEEGLDQTTAMTPLRVKEAIDAQGGGPTEEQVWTKDGTNLSPTTAGDNVLLKAGETLSITDLPEGTVLFAGPGGILVSEPALFWNAAQNRLGINTDNPGNTLSVNGDTDTTNMHVAGRVYHKNDLTTALRFGDDRIRLIAKTKDVFDAHRGGTNNYLKLGGSAGNSVDTIIGGVVMIRGSIVSPGKEGNFGIGELNPTAKLHTKGTVKHTNLTQATKDNILYIDPVTKEVTEGIVPTSPLLDEDNMVSNSDTQASTQQAIKAYVDNAIISSAVYQGVWDASLNIPTIISGVGTTGHFWKVSVAGDTDLDGVTAWNVGDWAFFNGSVWERVGNTEIVSSVFGRIGAVTSQVNDYTWVQIDKTTSNLADLTTKSHISLTDVGVNTHEEIDTFLGITLPATYVPYAEATADVDLGDFNLAATNGVFAGDAIVAGKTKTTDLQVNTTIPSVIDQVLTSVDTEGNALWKDNTFLSHKDTPTTYSTKKKFAVKVNSAEDGVVFLDPDGFPVKCIDVTGIGKGTPFKVTGWNAGENAQEIAKANQLTDIANGVVNKDMAVGDFLDDGGVGLGVIEGTALDVLDTSDWPVGTILYVGAGNLTNIDPPDGNSQPIAMVSRQHATLGTLQISAQYPKQIASDVRFAPSGSIVSTDVQSAIEEVAVAGGGWSEWVASGPYVVGDRVVYENIPYVCSIDNSDATFIITKWTLYSSIHNVDMVDPDGGSPYDMTGNTVLPPTQNSVHIFVKEKVGLNKNSLIRYQGVIDAVADIVLIQQNGSTKGDYWIGNTEIFLGAIGTLTVDGYFYTLVDLAPGTILGSQNADTIDENKMHHLLSIDEDDMVSDEDRLVPTQQSVKAYVDKDLFREERTGLISTPADMSDVLQLLRAGSALTFYMIAPVSTDNPHIQELTTVPWEVTDGAGDVWNFSSGATYLLTAFVSWSLFITGGVTILKNGTPMADISTWTNLNSNPDVNKITEGVVPTGLLKDDDNIWYVEAVDGPGGGEGTVTSVDTTGLASGGPFTDAGAVHVQASSQAQAEGGTDETTAMVPLSTAQAITEQRLFKQLGSNVFIPSLGNVGIGTNTPQYPLDVRGTIQCDDRIISRNNHLVLEPADTKYLEIKPKNDTHGVVIRRNASQDYASLGVYDSPATSGSYMRIGVGTADVYSSLALWNTGGLSIKRISVGTITQSTYGLYIQASATNSGKGVATAWANHSDKRFKVNKIPVKDGLTKVLQLQPVSFNWLAIEHDENNNVVPGEMYKSTDIGFIAQEIHDVIPEVSSKPEDENKELWNIDYAKITTVLVSAVQEQQKQIERLTKQIERLTKAVQEQQKQIKGLINS